MKIALAQTNPVVGDIAGNSAKIAEFIGRAKQGGADLVVFSELAVTGYPPRDLLRKAKFVRECGQAVEALAARCVGIAALVGFVRPNPDAAGRPLQNAAALLSGGKLQHVYVKTLLPTYDVFDETRYFQPGGEALTLDLAGTRFGLSICEDLWDAVALGRELYGADPIAQLMEHSSQVIVNIAASPFQTGKAHLREELFARQAARSGAPIVYVNQVGGNDELIFDGASCVLTPNGKVIGRAKSFEEDLLIVDLASGVGQRVELLGDDMERLSRALKLGLRDYVRKCGFSSVVLGLSGGIDSTVVAVLAADALGPKNVHCLAMPSRFSSDHSLSDAEALARNIGCNYLVVPIEPMHAAFEASLKPLLAKSPSEVAFENLQARIRGTIVMAFSNTYGPLALATGNKSELSTGYCTLYGDMCGGIAPIGDVLKTDIFRLAWQLNKEAGLDRIPPGVITKPPSAELKPNQFDQDTLPPYELLDEILLRYVEQDMTAENIIAAGYDAAVVHKVIRMVDFSEYKRKQAPPVLKVTARAFGSGRRMPIAQRYRPNGAF